MRKVKISELPLAETLVGLCTIGTDAQNRSVKVSLEFVEDAANNANEKAELADEKAALANTKAELAEAVVEEARQYGYLIVPTGMQIEYPEYITYGNLEELYINVSLTPNNVAKNVLFISDNKSVMVEPSGRIRVLGLGVSTIYVIPPMNTSLARIILIEVVNPSSRLNTLSSLRFVQSGNFRLT